MQDIEGALVLPTERPTTTVDLKRALLLFDHVRVFDPGERDVIAPSSLMGALGMPFSIGSGAVAPLGKISRYDDVMDEVLRECREAVTQGSIQILTGNDPMAGQFAIGFPPPPTGWPPAPWAFWNFRKLAGSSKYIEAACAGIPSGRALLDNDPDELAPGGRGLGSVNGQRLAALSDPSVPEEIASVVNRLAAARIGSVVKTLGMSTLMGLQPFTSDAGMASLIEMIQEDAKGVLLQVVEDDENEARTYRRAMRVEGVLFDQRMPDATLDALSFDEVLKLRTKAWGRAGTARAKFISTVRELSADCDSDDEFLRRCRSEIEAYEKASADLRHEWKNKGLVYGTWLMSALLGPGLLEQYTGLPSWSAAIGIALAAANQEGPAIRDFWRKERERSALPGRALALPYKHIL